MNGGGRLDVVCAQAGGRSRIRSLAYDGLMRCSRPLYEPSGAVRLIVSLLGPGCLHGDGFETRGRVEASAHLTVASQMATPVFPGARPSRTQTRWHVESGALLRLLGEPIMPYAGSIHRTETQVDVRGDGCAIVADVVALTVGANVECRTRIAIDGELAVADTLRPYCTAQTPPAAGSLIVATRDPQIREALRADARRILEGAAASVRGGTGGTKNAVVVRCTGDVWSVRGTIQALALHVRGKHLA